MTSTWYSSSHSATFLGAWYSIWTPPTAVTYLLCLVIATYFDAVTLALPDALTLALPDALTLALSHAVTLALPHALTLALPDAVTLALSHALTLALPETWKVPADKIG